MRRGRPRGRGSIIFLNLRILMILVLEKLGESEWLMSITGCAWNLLMPSERLRVTFSSLLTELILALITKHS